MRTRVICPCGVPVSMPEVYHRNSPGFGNAVDVCHDCIWHNSPACDTCRTYTQIESYLAAAWYCSAEAEQTYLEARDDNRGV